MSGADLLKETAIVVAKIEGTLSLRGRTENGIRFWDIMTSERVIESYYRRQDARERISMALFNGEVAA